MGDASNVRGALPDKLGEVTPVLEVAHVWLSLAIKVCEVLDLAVVEEIGNDGGDVVALDSGGDVLAVPTAINITVCCQRNSHDEVDNARHLRVVCVDAAGGDLTGAGSETFVPLEICDGVVLAVQVVRDDDLTLVGGGVS